LPQGLVAPSEKAMPHRRRIGRLARLRRLNQMQLDRRIAADHSLEHGRQKLGVQASTETMNLAATQATQRILEAR
jgi:hypothetical protein